MLIPQQKTADRQEGSQHSLGPKVADLRNEVDAGNSPKAYIPPGVF